MVHVSAVAVYLRLSCALWGTLVYVQYFFGTLASVGGECEAEPAAMFTVATAGMELAFQKDLFDQFGNCTAAATPAWMGYVERWMKNNFLVQIDAWQAMVAIAVGVLCVSPEKIDTDVDSEKRRRGARGVRVWDDGCGVVWAVCRHTSCQFPLYPSIHDTGLILPSSALLLSRAAACR